jgi:hypothetical protein
MSHVCIKWIGIGIRIGIGDQRNVLIRILLLMVRVRANGGAKHAVFAFLSDEFVEQSEQSETCQARKQK